MHGFPTSSQDDSQMTAFRNHSESPRTEALTPRAGYLCEAEETLHALSRQKGLPAGPEGGHALQAEQKCPADQHVGISRVVALPVLMEPEQAGDVASVHRPAAVRP